VEEKAKPQGEAVTLTKDELDLARESGIPLELIQEMWANYNLPPPCG
jgi:hypothetical protein